MQFEVVRPGILFDRYGEVPRESVYGPYLQRFIREAVPVIQSAFKAHQYERILVCYFDRDYLTVLVDNQDFHYGRSYPGAVLRADSDRKFFHQLEANFGVFITRIQVTNTDKDPIDCVGLVVYEHQGAILDAEAAKQPLRLVESEPLPFEVETEIEERVPALA